jgi:hypothetical protein
MYRESRLILKVFLYLIICTVIIRDAHENSEKSRVVLEHSTEQTKFSLKPTASTFSVHFTTDPSENLTPSLHH